MTALFLKAHDSFQLVIKFVIFGQEPNGLEFFDKIRVVLFQAVSFSLFLLHLGLIEFIEGSSLQRHEIFLFFQLFLTDQTQRRIYVSLAAYRNSREDFGRSLVQHPELCENRVGSRRLFDFLDGHTQLIGFR